MLRNRLYFITQNYNFQSVNDGNDILEQLYGFIKVQDS